MNNVQGRLSCGTTPNVDHIVGRGLLRIRIGPAALGAVEDFEVCTSSPTQQTSPPGITKETTALAGCSIRLNAFFWFVQSAAA